MFGAEGTAMKRRSKAGKARRRRAATQRQRIVKRLRVTEEQQQPKDEPLRPYGKRALPNEIATHY